MKEINTVRLSGKIDNMYTYTDSISKKNRVNISLLNSGKYYTLDIPEDEMKNKIKFIRKGNYVAVTGKLDKDEFGKFYITSNSIDHIECRIDTI